MFSYNTDAMFPRPGRSHAFRSDPSINSDTDTVIPHAHGRTNSSCSCVSSGSVRPSASGPGPSTSVQQHTHSRLLPGQRRDIAHTWPIPPRHVLPGPSPSGHHYMFLGQHPTCHRPPPCTIPMPAINGSTCSVPDHIAQPFPSTGTPHIFRCSHTVHENIMGQTNPVRVGRVFSPNPSTSTEMGFCGEYPISQPLPHALPGTHHAKLVKQPSYMNREYLELAMLVCNTFRGKLFPCTHCRYVTDRRNNLKRHVTTMHGTSDKSLECCGVKFGTKALLREHIAIFHHNGYSCPFCGRRFCRKALLKRHLAVHSGRKDFICPHCDYATSHKSNLERHKKIHEKLRQQDLLDSTSSSPSTTADTGTHNNGNGRDVRVSIESDLSESDFTDEEIEVDCLTVSSNCTPPDSTVNVTDLEDDDCEIGLQALANEPDKVMSVKADSVTSSDDVDAPMTSREVASAKVE